jgi:hypothetical protein
MERANSGGGEKYTYPGAINNGHTKRPPDIHNNSLNEKPNKPYYLLYMPYKILQTHKHGGKTTPQEKLLQANDTAEKGEKKNMSKQSDYIHRLLNLSTLMSFQHRHAPSPTWPIQEWRKSRPEHKNKTPNPTTLQDCARLSHPAAPQTRTSFSCKSRQHRSPPSS